METTDTLIVGAGPAGTTCAYLLRKAGVDCLLVDFATFPREKVCGGGLTPKAYTLLAELMPGLHYDYRTVDTVHVGLDHKRLGTIELPQAIRVVSRKEFDYALLRQYLEAGGQFRQEAFKAFEVQPDNGIVVEFRSGRKILCRHLVAADGANSRVRHQLLGRYDGNILCMEQEIPTDSDAIEGMVSPRYDHGYYYLFPSVHGDVVGLGARGMTPQHFREVLASLGIAETRFKGANIPVREVESGMDQVMLIGDAGGFANKLSYEGLYYAVATGRNAAEAVIKGLPFSVTNRDIFRRKRKEHLLAELFYSRTGMFLVRHFSSHTRLVRKIFVTGLGR